MTTDLGFIGTGSMGAPMSRNLMARGYGLVVHDRRSEATADLIARGAKPAKSSREIADRASIVFACLPDNDSCMDVVFGQDGIVHGKAVKLFVNLGTTGSEFSRRMTDRLKERSIAMLDAPISGGAAGAANASLAIMVSGPKAEFDKIEPLLNCIGKNITFVSEQVGSAQTMKLANNLLSATAYAITAEAFVMGAKAGLDPEMMVKVINAGSGRNSATEDKFPRAVLTRTFDLGATYNIICKDLKLCLAEAEGFGVPMWVGSAVRHLFTCGAAQGGGQRDLTTLVQHLEEQAHTQIPKVR